LQSLTILDKEFSCYLLPGFDAEVRRLMPIL
jgi:hypothetical protein